MAGWKYIVGVVLSIVSSWCGAQGREVHVSLSGSASGDGSEQRPMNNLQHAFDQLKAGDTCIIHEGQYRSFGRVATSGTAEQPIEIRAVEGMRVEFNGTDEVLGPWEKQRDDIYRFKLDRPVSQLFCDGRVLVEARWPNMKFPAQLWDKSTWAKADEGSRYGKIIDPALKDARIDATGARIILNVAHQFYTWERLVNAHQNGQAELQYAKDLDGITKYAELTTPWEDDYYFLQGKLELLDAPGEWFADRDGWLYLWLPEGDDPAKHKIEVRVRDLAIKVENCEYIQIKGLQFFAATFAVNGDHCLVQDCRLEYPTAPAPTNSPSEDGGDWSTQTLVQGDFNTIRHCAITYAPYSGLVLVGQGLLVEENLIHDVCWHGSMRNPALSLKSGSSRPEQGSTVRRNTVHDFGSAGIVYRKNAYLVEYNDVYNGGRASEDVALIYTGQPDCAGSEVRYNWAHRCQTRSGKGIGIRGDDQSRNLTIHHNVVWDCGLCGMVAKGDGHKIFHNTVFDIGSPNSEGRAIDLRQGEEPVKHWREQKGLLKAQNLNSFAYNNASVNLSGGAKGTPLVLSERIADNFVGAEFKLENPATFDFRPRVDSPLLDAGRVLAGLNDQYHGKAPDIGAYERGTKPWRPGITWQMLK